MLIVVWALTPLQNGIFTTNVSDLTTPVNISNRKSLMSLVDQVAGLSGSFMMTGYSIAWLAQKPPAYTTTTYALAPFQTWQGRDGDIPASTNQTITGPTTLYQTSLECLPPANISFSGESKAAMVSFDDGKGCATNPIIPAINPAAAVESAIWSPYYIGYWNDPRLEWSLLGAECPKTSNHSFLAVWTRATNSTPKFNTNSGASALFCTPSYHVQPVNATIALSDFSVLSTVPLGPRTPLTEDLFNVTHFEYTLGVGSPPGSFDDPKQQNDPIRFTDASNRVIVDQTTQLSNLSIALPVSNMIGYAVGLSDRNLDRLTDPDQLRQAFERSHQLLFALAVRDIMVDDDKAPAVGGVVHSTLQTVRVVPVFALLSQAMLMVILIFTCFLLCFSSKRWNRLCSDPNSWAKVMSIADDLNIRKLFFRSDTATGEELARSVSMKRFRVGIDLSKPKSTLHVLEEHEAKTQQLRPPSDSKHIAAKLVRPLEYSWLFGVPFILSLAALVAGLIIVRQKGLMDDGITSVTLSDISLIVLGLPLPSRSVAVQNLLTNALPTILASFLEPLWVLLNRLACVMRPMEELHKGSAPARRSLLLKYNSIPPQLNIFRALRARHFLLGALSFVTLLANVLTVAFSGLFTQNAVFLGQGLSLKPTLIPQESQDLSAGNKRFASVLLGTNFVALSNFTGGASLQPWVSQHYFFPPLEIDATGSPTSRYSMQVFGYGADLKCTPMTTSDPDNAIEFTLDSTASVGKVITSHKQKDGSVIQCHNEKFLIAGTPAGHKGIEFAGSVIDVGGDIGDAKHSGFCQDTIFKAWIRADLKKESSNRQQNSLTGALSPVSIENLQTSFISCRPRAKSAKFNLTISRTGTVIDATQTSDPKYDDQSINLTSILRETVLVVSEPAATHIWHNGTEAGNLPQQMLKALKKSPTFFDPALPPPDFSTASAALSDLYSRLFAIHMSMRSDLLRPVPPDAPLVPSQLEIFETRIFMSEIMFKIALVILCIDLLVAIVFYVCAPPAFLPRMPTTIASQIAFFAASHVVEDVRDAEAEGGLEELDRKGHRYAYGRYVGVDGRAHVGIERVPFVTPLDVRGRGEEGMRKRWRLRWGGWGRKSGRENVPSGDDG
jgi:Protein of unknown function (DUF3433)